MSRMFLQYVLPILVPFVIYGAWLALSRRKARPAGADAAPEWREAPWTWLLIAGLGLLIASLVGLALQGGDPPGKTYVAPQFIEGEIVPARTE